MRLTPYVFILGLALLSASLTAQELVVPKAFTFNKASDYAQFNKKIIEIADWLEKTPPGESTEKRKEASAFFISWLSGTPDVSITIREAYTDLADKNSEMLVIFMAGWSRFVLQHPDRGEDELAGAMAGLESVFRSYESGGYRKDRKIEKLMGYRDNGKLEAWLKDKISEEE